MGQGKSRKAEGINGRIADRTSNDMRKGRSIFRSEHQFRLKFKVGGGIMPTTAQEIYIQVVRTLSPTERLRGNSYAQRVITAKCRCSRAK